MCDAFRASLSQVNPDTIIFSISEQGGVGKTTLLKLFRRITTEFNHIAAYVDEGSQVNPVTNVPETLDRLAQDLSRQSGKFDKLFNKFQKRCSLLSGQSRQRSASGQL